ncbi:WD repeat-containing protein 11-like isoform X3 [Gordionus sp. m RMFG-2023]|uniref:WD repeat-containing protein 11-like isoform X3 n=1 Tax=Gordionus sp. m RMFG-2023 TaxID=3053472 RepID=UPI0031FCCD1D
MEYKSVFLPGSFNFSNQTLDWGQNDLLAYTSLNLIIIFDVNLQNVVQVLKCNELVAMVKWGPIKRDMDSSTKHKQISSNAMICLSVDIDNNIILWDALFGIKIIEINNQTLTKIKNYKILDIQWILRSFKVNSENLMALYSQNNTKSKSHLVIYHAFNGTELWKIDFAENVQHFAFDPFDNSRFIISGQGYITLYLDFDPKNSYSSSINSDDPLFNAKDPQLRRRKPIKFLISSYSTNKSEVNKTIINSKSEILDTLKRSSNERVELENPFSHDNNIIPCKSFPIERDIATMKEMDFNQKPKDDDLTKTAMPTKKEDHPEQNNILDDKNRYILPRPNSIYSLQHGTDRSSILTDLNDRFNHLTNLNFRFLASNAPSTCSDSLNTNKQKFILNQPVSSSYNTPKNDCIGILWSQVLKDIIYLAYPTEIVMLMLTTTHPTCPNYNLVNLGALATRKKKNYMKSVILATRDNPIVKVLTISGTAAFTHSFNETLFVIYEDGSIRVCYQHELASFFYANQIYCSTSDMEDIYNFMTKKFEKEDKDPISIVSSFTDACNNAEYLHLTSKSTLSSGLKHIKVHGAAISPFSCNKIVILISTINKSKSNNESSEFLAKSKLNTHLIVWEMNIKEKYKDFFKPNYRKNNVKLIPQPNIFYPAASEISSDTPNRSTTKETSLHSFSYFINKLVSKSNGFMPSENDHYIEFLMTGLYQHLSPRPKVISILSSLIGFDQFANRSKNIILAVGSEFGTIQIINLSKNTLIAEFSHIHENPIKFIHWTSNNTLLSFSHDIPHSFKIDGNTTFFKNDIIYLNVLTGYSYGIRSGQKDTSTVKLIKASASGDYLILTFLDHIAQPPELWNLKTFTLVRRFPKNFPKIINLSWSNTTASDSEESFAFSDRSNRVFRFSLSQNVVRSGLQLYPSSFTSTNSGGNKRMHTTWQSLAFQDGPAPCMVLASRDGTIMGVNVKIPKKDVRIYEAQAGTGVIWVDFAPANLSKKTEKDNKVGLNDDYKGALRRVLARTMMGLQVWDLLENVLLFEHLNTSPFDTIIDVQWVSYDHIVYLTHSGELRLTNYTLRNIKSFVKSNYTRKNFGNIKKLSEDFLSINCIEKHSAIKTTMFHPVLDIFSTMYSIIPKSSKISVMNHGQGLKIDDLTNPNACVFNPRISLFLKWIICNFCDLNQLTDSKSSLYTFLQSHIPSNNNDEDIIILDILIDYIFKMQFSERILSEHNLTLDNSTMQRCIVASLNLSTDHIETNYWLYALECIINHVKRNNQDAQKDLYSDVLQILPSPFSSIPANHLSNNHLYKASETLYLLLRYFSSQFSKSPLDVSKPSHKKYNNKYYDLSPLDEIKWIGLKDIVLKYLLESDKLGYEAAFFASVSKSDNDSHASIKLIATNLIASGNLEDGLSMLGCIGKYIDACLYLQTYGYWEKSIWLAKLTLTEKDYIYIVDKWANHLERTSNSSLMMASMVYLHIGSFYKACQALIKAQRGDMAYLLYKGLKEFAPTIRRIMYKLCQFVVTIWKQKSCYYLL